MFDKMHGGHIDGVIGAVDELIVSLGDLDHNVRCAIDDPALCGSLLFTKRPGGVIHVGICVKRVILHSSTMVCQPSHF